MFIKISQNLQENNCARVSFLIKLPAVAVDDHHIIQVYYSLILKIFALMLFSKEKNFVEWKICIQDCIQQSSRLDQAKFTSVMYFNFQFNCFIITLIVFMVNLIFIKILLDRL